MVSTGLDRVARGDLSKRLRGRPWALLAHPASVDRRLRHALDVLTGMGVSVPLLLGPEHGWAGAAQDMEPVGEGQAGRRVVSLYGSEVSSLRPTPDQLEGVDGIIIDLQDVGSRYYTYVATMGFCMETAAAIGKEVIVLDRPNPIGGRPEDVEGPSVEPGFESFVSAFPAPMRHGLTMGELAVWWRAHGQLDVDLTVVEVEGWAREDMHDATGLPWVLPSPNMPTLDSALVYPGMCLFEGTDLSEGRGTTRPFELVGAPGIDGQVWAARATADAGPGLVLRPTVFKPMFQKHGGQHCGGVQLHVTDRSSFRPVRAAVALLVAARAEFPQAWGWREAAYEFVADRLAIDLLFGSDAPRQMIDGGASVDEVLESFGSFAAQWAQTHIASQ